MPAALARESKELLAGLKLNTVCAKARCPNLNRCFNNRELTFIILGDACTRNCRFCAVEKAVGRSLSVDETEPERVAEAVSRIGLDYAVVTSVTRDDLSDGGAGYFVRTIKAIRSLNNKAGVEVLTPDFQGRPSAVKAIIDALPQVFGHNLETVKRLTPELRPQADYRRSLDVLRLAKKYNRQLVTKSSVMLGLGESKAEVIAAMRDLKSVDCDIIVLGQYLAPSPLHYPVKEFVRPEQFLNYRDIALSLGFKAASSAPLARSSYEAKHLYEGAVKCMM